jgi:hypothetical protein
MTYKIGDVVRVWVECKPEFEHNKMTGTIYILDPFMAIRDAKGITMQVKPEDDDIKLLTDGEALLWRLES